MAEQIIEHVVDYQVIDPSFVARLEAISRSTTLSEMLGRALELMLDATGAKIVTISEIDDAGVFRLVKSSFTNDVIDASVLNGTVVSEYSIAHSVRSAMRPVFRQVGPDKAGHPVCFVENYYIGVPFFAPSDPDRLSGVVTLAMRDADHFNERTVTTVDLISGTYAFAKAGLAQVASGILVGRSIEKERLTQRLHDATVQEVFACECEVTQLIEARRRPDHDTGQTDQALAELLAHLRAINRHLRAVIATTVEEASVGPQPIDTVIAPVIAEHDQAGGCETALIVDGQAQVPEVVADVVRSVLAESLANVRKHARAQAAVVSCILKDGVIALSVADDGVGMGATRQAEHNPEQVLHFGIANMRSMVEGVGGSFSIEWNSDEQGTLVTARIPVSPAAV